MAIKRAQYPTLPAVEKHTGTLLDTATVTDGITWLDGADLFQSFNCMKFTGEAIHCAPSAKEFDEAGGWVNGFQFAAYGGVQCKAIGLDQAEFEAEVERVFSLGESTAVERALMSVRFLANEDDLWEAPVDITPDSGAVKPGVGVALLEGFAANEYVGQPTLHMPRTIASLLLGVDGVEAKDGVLRTKLGAKIAAGTGYDFPNLSPTGVEATAGEKWLYATGSVWIGRGPLEVRQAMAHTDNDVFVLAERPYIAAVDCFAAAIRVTVEG